MVDVQIRHTKWGYDRISILNHATSTDVCNYVSGIAWTIAASILNIVPEDKILKRINTYGHIEYEVVPNEQYNMIFQVAAIGFKQLEVNNPQDIVVEVLER